MTRITVAQVRSIRDDYAENLPNWEKIGRDALVRHDGIVGQRVWFDRLRTGEYRPTVMLEVFVAPSSVGGTGALTEFLSIKRRRVALKSHEAMLKSVCEGLRQDVAVSVDAPISPERVRAVVEMKTAPNLAGSYALACLSAYLDEPQEFTRWLESFDAISARLRSDNSERRSFLTSVETEMAQGTATEMLRTVAKEELAKAGIASST